MEIATEKLLCEKSVSPSVNCLRGDTHDKVSNNGLTIIEHRQQADKKICG